MFELEREIQNWCESALPDDCGTDPERLAELADHLHCEIERLEGQGMPTQKAFEQATQRLGKAKEIMMEYSKNQSFIARLCALDRRLGSVETLSNPLVKKAASRLTLGNAILWAAAMIASALLVGDAEKVGYLVPLVFVPLWIGSTLVINGTMSALERRL